MSICTFFPGQRYLRAPPFAEESHTPSLSDNGWHYKALASDLAKLELAFQYIVDGDVSLLTILSGQVNLTKGLKQAESHVALAICQGPKYQRRPLGV